MQIADKIANYGMTCSGELAHHITTLVVEENITKIIETGSFLGLGTTRAVLTGLNIHKLRYQFISIEVNPHYYRQAKDNNIGTDVSFINALSIPRKLLPVNITYEGLPSSVIVDHQDPQNYLKEVNFRVPDAMLNLAGEMKPELVILDSAGHLGLIEFKYLMSVIPNHEFYLVLDDIGHFKHYHTMQLIETLPEKFDIVWRSEDSEAHQAAIIKVNA